MQIKRITALLLTAILAVSLAACGNSQTADKPSDSTNQQTEVSENTENHTTEMQTDDQTIQETANDDGQKSTLILYFSADNTKNVEAVSSATPMADGTASVEWIANIIQTQVGGDLIPIIPSVDYPLGYDELADYAKQERDDGGRPAFEDLGVDPTSYDIVFIVLATKLHMATEEPKQDGSVYHTLRRHVEASLEHLQTDYIDLYYLHRVNPEIAVEDVAEGMGRLIEEGLIRGWGMSMVNVAYLERVQDITPLTAVQNIYSMMDRAYEKGVIPYCMEHNIGFVPFSPIASGYLSGKVDPNQEFKGDDVRQWVPQLKKENMIANRPIWEVLSDMADKKNATNAQISLAWMLHKYPHVVPIPGSKNQERILENLGAWNVALTDDEFRALEDALNSMAIHGQRRELHAPTEFIDE